MSLPILPLPACIPWKSSLASTFWNTLTLLVKAETIVMFFEIFGNVNLRNL